MLYVRVFGNLVILMLPLSCSSDALPLHFWSCVSHAVLRLRHLDEVQNRDSGGSWLSVLKGMQGSLAADGFKQVRLCEFGL